MDYNEFIANKKHSFSDSGIAPEILIDGAFDYQQYAAEKAIRKGRYASFIDTGLGKTLIELMVADCYTKRFNKSVLIITPLAVAFQFIKEAEKFGIDDIEYSRDGAFSKKNSRM